MAIPAALAMPETNGNPPELAPVVQSPPEASGVSGAPVPSQGPAQGFIQINGHPRKLTIMCDGKDLTDRLIKEGKYEETVRKIGKLLNEKYFTENCILEKNHSASISSESGKIFEGTKLIKEIIYKDSEFSVQKAVLESIQKIVQDIVGPETSGEGEKEPGGSEVRKRPVSVGIAPPPTEERLPDRPDNGEEEGASPNEENKIRKRDAIVRQEQGKLASLEKIMS
jgi:hypothetical protein